MWQPGLSSIRVTYVTLCGVIRYQVEREREREKWNVAAWSFLNGGNVARRIVGWAGQLCIVLSLALHTHKAHNVASHHQKDRNQAVVSGPVYRRDGNLLSIKFLIWKLNRIGIYLEEGR